MHPLRLLVLAAIMATPLAATAQTLAKAWEATGFANPDSALWDAARTVIYVSNVNGAPADKDGNGYLSKLSPEGRLITEKWVTGLDAPKGMALVKGRLYVADIDRLVAVDVGSGKVVKTWAAPGARSLEDVTADDSGNVYASDLLGNAVWRLSAGKLDKWLTDPMLESPNGLKVDKGRLVIAAWGSMTGDGSATARPGALKAVSIADRMVRDLGPPFGNLDGLEPDGKDGWLASDGQGGGLFQVDRRGQPRRIQSLDPGAADIGTIPEHKLVLVPMTRHGRVIAYRLP